jgi:O-antigen ligase
MARAYLSNANDLAFAFRTLFLLILALLPFTVVENLTGRSILLEFGRSAFPYAFPDSAAELRYGLNRPQVVFEHAILYGMFCTMAVAPAYYIVGYGGWFVVRVFYLALMTGATLLSLSAGPLVATGFQLLLVGWDHGFFLRAIKWKTFLIGLLTAYLVVEIFSNRPPIHVFIDYFTFNAGTAFTRVRQWDCGMLSIAKNPILGFGLGGDWTRCPGVTNSIDNFFLAMAMRNGVPAILFLLLAIVLITIRVGRAPVDGQREDWARRGLLFAIVGVSVGAATVHFWNATYAMFFFLLGSAMWIIDRGRRIAIERRAEAAKSPGGPAGVAGAPWRADRPLAQNRTGSAR